MSGDTGEIDTAEWDVSLRPRLVPMLARITAAVIVVAGVVVAIFNDRASGAYLRPVDQVAMACIACILAGGVLLLTRPRLKVGPAGLAVRNVVEYRMIPWREVVDVSFPPGKRWARVDLDYGEYVPVLAIQVTDRQHAVEAMDTVRSLMDRYHSH
ncbi:MAG TPA: PH domain-containing protein [Mycobacterium sp.]|nr:PH domain-containing protein [Mycobacterium sp.]HPZ94900.1 PH domain-containing protein [Mycobacterium sp.]HQE14127.1 PH domain-containing protein [Mycobacterium sp.]